MRSDLIGVVLVVMGAVVFAIMGASNTTADVTLEIMEARFRRPGFIVYATVQVAVIFALLSSVATSAAYRWRDGLTKVLLKPFSMRLKLLEQRVDLELEHLREEVRALREEVHSTTEIARRLSVTERDLHGDTADHAGAASLHALLRRRASTSAEAAERPLGKLRQLESDAKHHWKDAYVYAATSGAIGAVSVLFAGCSAKSIVQAVNQPDDNPFGRPLPYVFVIGMVVCIMLQQDFLNKALMRGDTMTIFPVFQVFWISLGVAGGITFYHEEVSSTVEEICAYLLMAAGFCFLIQHGRNGDSYKPPPAKPAHEGGDGRSGGSRLPGAFASEDDGEQASIELPAHGSVKPAGAANVLNPVTRIVAEGNNGCRSSSA